MPNYNKVILCGNLTRDVELRYTATGAAVGVFGLAINRQWKTESGEKKDEVTFADVTAFGKTAETMAQYLKKGRPVLIEGRFRTESWDDKASGAKRSKLSVVCESFQFLDSGGERAEKPASKPAASEPPKGTVPPEEDDVPF